MYTITVYTSAGAHGSAPLTTADKESLSKQLKGARFSASEFPEALIAFPSFGGGVTFLIPTAIIGWDIEKTEPTSFSRTGQTAGDYSVLGDA